MKDKVKEFRDKNPELDFAAGFIPGVGEAQDVHDFVHAAKKRDLAGMSWALLGLALPGLAGGQLRKLAKFGDEATGGGIKKIMNEVLPDTLKSKGWKTASDGAFVNPQGRRFIRHDGKLTAEDSVKNIKEAADREVRQAANQKAAKKAAEKQKKAFDDAAEAFKKETDGLDFSLENWQRLAPGHKMTDIEKRLYTTQAFPGFVESYRNLTQSGKFKKVGNKWYGWFDEPVADGISDKLPALKERWAKGWRELDGKEGAMTYIIVHSKQAEGKFMYNGITMHQGVPEILQKGNTKITARRNFENGDQNFEKWFDSNRAGAHTYSNPDGAAGGLKIFGLPIRPSLLYPYMSDRPRLIKRQTANPTSNNWDGNGGWIGSFVEKNPEKKVNMSEGPLIDYLASKKSGSPVKGVFTIVGENIPVKSVFGGSGMYSTEGKNLYKPFMQFAAPIGLTSLIGYKAYGNSKTEREMR